VEGAGQRADLVELALTLGGEAARFAVTAVPETALAAQDLGGFDVVALVGPESLSSGERAALVRFVQAGGGLLVFPSERADAADYDALFGALGGGTLGPAVGRLGGERPIARFGDVDLDHPLFEGVFDEQRGQVESPDVLLARPYRPGAGDENTLIRLSTGAPFLQELRSERGTAFVFAVAPDPRWSDLPVRGLLVPLLYRAVYYLAADADTGEALPVRQAGALRVSGGTEGLRLVGPDGLECVPEQRAVPGGVLLEVDAEVREPGVYDVLDGERLVRRVAFNPVARE